MYVYICVFVCVSFIMSLKWVDACDQNLTREHLNTFPAYPVHPGFRTQPCLYGMFIRYLRHSVLLYVYQGLLSTNSPWLQVFFTKRKFVFKHIQLISFRRNRRPSFNKLTEQPIKVHLIRLTRSKQKTG
jgi:hypothetical protein